MAIPAGLTVALQRVQTIENGLSALGVTGPSSATSAVGNTFHQIFQGKTQEPSGKAAQYQPLVNSEAAQAGLPPSLVNAVIQTESGFNPSAVSSSGAQGLMQLMPSTAQSLGVQSTLDPAQNIHGGTQYLKSLIDKYQSVPNALAAYNAGPAAVDKYGGVPPYSETQNYVQKVLTTQSQFQQQQQQP